MIATPVLILAYNRSDLLDRVLTAVQGVSRERRIYVAIDGPKQSDADRDRVRLTEELARAHVPAERLLTRAVNLGMAKAVPEALSWFFDREPAGIILEDDCVPAHDFFTFCDEMLARGSAVNIGSVCGSNFVSQRRHGSSAFLAEPHVWGWGTWAHIWNGYSEAAERAFVAAEAQSPRRVYGATWWYRRRLLKRWSNGELESWAIPFLHYLARQGLYSVTPDVNLISNVGVGDSASHTRNSSRFSERALATWRPASPIDALIPNSAYSRRVGALLLGQVAAHRAKRSIRTVLEARGVEV